MDRSEVQGWLDWYVEAWKSYDRGPIEALFAEDVEFRYHPYDDPVRGRDAVVKAWLGEGSQDVASTRDEPAPSTLPMRRWRSTATSRSRLALAHT
jgi:hypothetical protein